MQQPVDEITLSTFLEWESTQEHKHELLHGRVLAFSGANFDHNHMADNIQARLNAALRRPCYAYGSDIIIETTSRKGDCGFRAEVVVTYSDEDFGKGRYLKHPRIVVEVRSPTNSGKEWDAKLLEYSSTVKIEQLVIVESESRAASSYLRDERGGWQPAVVTIGDGSLRFPSVDVDMPLDDVYRFTTLEIP